MSSAIKDFVSASKSDKTTKRNFTDRIWNFFTSLKSVILLLLILSVLSVAGTVIEQNKPLQEYYEVFKPSTVALFNSLGLLDMYHSWWFISCLGLLALNIIACTMDRYTTVMSGLRKKNLILDEALEKTLNPKDKIKYALPVDDVEKKVLELAGKNFGGQAVVTITEDGSRHYFFEKGKYSRLAFFFTHVSVLLIFVGALVGSFFGFKGYVNIYEGETIGRLETRTGQIKTLDFSVKCNAFTADFYPNGMPKDYTSDLSVIKDGMEVLRKSIKVNDPLNFQGITFYQSGYGSLPFGNELKLKTYTGLQVNKDPGEWFVWVGSLLLVGGIMAAFFMSHKKLWVCLRKDKKGRTELSIGGVVNKNRAVFVREVEGIIRRLKEVA